MAAFLPGEPLFDESEQRGDMIMLAEPALVRSVADALDAFDHPDLSPPLRRRWRRQPVSTWRIWPLTKTSFGTATAEPQPTVRRSPS